VCFLGLAGGGSASGGFIAGLLPLSRPSAHPQNPSRLKFKNPKSIRVMRYGKNQNMNLFAAFTFYFLVSQNAMDDFFISCLSLNSFYNNVFDESIG